MVAIITDSTACIPPELAERYGIEIVPLHLIFAGRTFVDSLTADTGEFYDVLRSSSDRPTTAAPSPGLYVAAIERAARRSNEILCVTVSQQFSVMGDSARHAIGIVKAESPSLDLRLFDSGNAAMAQGFVVLEAARAAAIAAPFTSVIARAQQVAGKVTLLAMLDTLTYLARGGRVPRVAAWAASSLQIKPIVRFSASGIKLAARARTRPRALTRLAELLEAAAAGRRVHLAVHHANAPDSATYLANEAARRLTLAECYVTEFTQVMAVHTGPGLAGYAFWCE